MVDAVSCLFRERTVCLRGSTGTMPLRSLDECLAEQPVLILPNTRTVAYKSISSQAEASPNALQ